MSPKKTALLISLLALGLASGAYYYAHGDAEKTKPKSKPPVLVTLATASRQDVAQEISAIGTVVPFETVAVRSRIDSQILDVKFHDGDTVKQGDVLFVLDDRSLKAQLAAQTANIARDKAQKDNLCRQYERKKSLAGKGYETTSNLDDAKSACVVQTASVTATEAALESLRVQLQYTQITAPISGRTGTINVTAGNNVKANDQTLVVINQIKPVRVQISLAQKHLEPLHQSLTAQSINVSALHEGAKTPSLGKLDYIDNSIDTSTGTFIAKASFPNEDEALWPGMFVNTTLQTGVDKNVLTIPEPALQHGQNGDFVFVVHDNKAEKRPVKIRGVEKGLVLVDDGLKESETIAVDGLLKLDNGTIVTTADKGAKQ